MLVRRIIETLPRFAYRFADEIELHGAIADVLSAAQIPFAREVVAGPRDRFDFLIPDGIVLEVKVKGSLPEALHQIARYAARTDVLTVVLVTTKLWGRSSMEIHGKPVHVLKIKGAAF